MEYFWCFIFVLWFTESFSEASWLILGDWRSNITSLIMPATCCIYMTETGRWYQSAFATFLLWLVCESQKKHPYGSYVHDISASSPGIKYQLCLWMQVQMLVIKARLVLLPQGWTLMKPFVVSNCSWFMFPSPFKLLWEDRCGTF